MEEEKEERVLAASEQAPNDTPRFLESKLRQQKAAETNHMNSQSQAAAANIEKNEDAYVNLQEEEKQAAPERESHGAN